MAGTGDLDAFRLFRALRWKCDDATLYGTHMAFSAAIGLLFLGDGKCTLGSRPEDVAMLITGKLYVYIFSSFSLLFIILSFSPRTLLQRFTHIIQFCYPITSTICKPFVTYMC